MLDEVVDGGGGRRNKDCWSESSFFCGNPLPLTTPLNEDMDPALLEAPGGGDTDELDGGKNERGGERGGLAEVDEYPHDEAPPLIEDELALLHEPDPVLEKLQLRIRCC